jgi:hypothetical protein
MDEVRLYVEERARVEMQERLARDDVTGEFVAHRDVLSARRPKRVRAALRIDEDAAVRRRTGFCPLGGLEVSRELQHIRSGLRCGVRRAPLLAPRVCGGDPGEFRGRIPPKDLAVPCLDAPACPYRPAQAGIGLERVNEQAKATG